MTEDQQPEDNWEWESPERRRPRRLDEDTDDIGFPTIWLLIGGLAGLLTIGLIALGVAQVLNKRATPTPTPTVLPTTVLPLTPTVATLVEDTPAPVPTVIVEPTPPQSVDTPTPIPPTPAPPPVAPTQIEVGGYVQIVNTGGSGLSLRAGPGTNNARLTVAGADSTLPVVGGPKPDEEGTTDETGAVYTWWNVRDSDGTEGWARGDFLAPSLPPE